MNQQEAELILKYLSKAGAVVPSSIEDMEAFLSNAETFTPITQVNDPLEILKEGYRKPKKRQNHKSRQ